MSFLLPIALLMLLFIVYCAICVVLTYIIFYAGLYIFDRFFPQERYGKYNWYKFFVIIYFIALLIAGVYIGLRTSSMLMIKI